ncbi:ABC-type transporter, substrate-binding lipoprotein [Corynebacterium glutamicum MB001]|uniref:Sugar ABC transporter substrate-binding protein n=3 Tax=Corynebacterium TaxID=1716 RepID=A0A0F6SRI5_9CORY|nr:MULTISPECIES: ABC transporter substrate-binding protein [Corynebacterium]AGN19748.1 ABC transporter substrate-binding protein [Corynebacterium glutamicum SCgG1]AGN22773.1 ABC transporter substrate-binding protein [Corynebacterium glutamicum SCgG2]AGT05981.1 ABC-type transporter, substrate-binding lipoprotein [Corynebacterium glutamicum MB001]AIK85678.1 sugar ABC transporter substrate-binding protein [Corynebacterium glutamicum]AIK88463.1 sugar ABC transporter substrate-binding protein [Cory
MFSSRSKVLASIFTVGALALASCSSDSSDSSTSTDAAGGDSYRVGINQLVQHPALDAATTGFKEAFEEAGVDVTFDEQNANGEQGTALTISQQFASDNLDLVLAVATPAAQATAQNITDIPVLFTAVTDAVSAELVDSNEAPGGNVTGTSDIAPIEQQLELLQQLVPDAKSIGIVYASGEVNSQVQVDEVTKAAEPLGLSVNTQTVTTVNEIQQAVEALGDVDVIYVPTDNMVVSGISSLVQVAEQKQIPVIGAESGTVEGGALATLGIDYTELGRQTGEMALRILQDGEDPATMPVETATEFTYVINEDAAERQGVEIPQEILDKAERV